MVCQLPRISNRLREVLKASGNYPEYENRDLASALALKRQKKRSTVPGKENGNGSVPSWSEVQALASEVKNGKYSAAQMKKMLREYLSQVSQLHGENVSADDNESIALYLYNVSQQCDESAMKAEVKSVCPGAQSSQINTIVASLKLLKDGFSKCAFATSAAGSGDVFDYSDSLFGNNISLCFDGFFGNENKTLRRKKKKLSFKNNEDILGKTIIERRLSVKSYDSDWLRKMCFEDSSLWSTGIFSSPEECFNAIFDQLASNKPDEEVQLSMLDLLGFEHIEFINHFVQSRKNIVKSMTESTLEEDDGTYKKKPLDNFSFNSSNPSSPSRKRKGKKNIPIDEDSLSHEEYLKLKAASNSSRDYCPLPRDNSSLFDRQAYTQAPKLKHVYTSAVKGSVSGVVIGGAKVQLPEGTERKNFKAYEEVTIPPTSHLDATTKDNLVNISEFSELGRQGFKGFKTLNRIQSIVFETAYKSNENLLICAPTGAGKTNVAMMTILHEIENNVSNGVIQRDKFKIVYVAPMKALATEMVASFGKRLAPLGIVVKELTGDMQLTRTEIMNTQMIVTTPEKWDVVTRKGTGDTGLATLVKLLIIDEVHLLQDERGPVIEVLVARTLRQVESSQSMIRIVGLSATLPSYVDVANFLRVNVNSGLFFFDGSYRPVPLLTKYAGVKSKKNFQKLADMNEYCHNVVAEHVRNGHQVMVFVHSRNSTSASALAMHEIAQLQGTSGVFDCHDVEGFPLAEKAFASSKNKVLKELFPKGFAIHHAGMLRADRLLVEKWFHSGCIKVLFCTATLAWGVNLPAHAVVIKGTDVYDAKKGAFVDIGVLDIQQIFGRAGRPQFDTFGEGTLITSHAKLSHYISLMHNQIPIESQFMSRLTDNLNAEIALGTVANMDEAVQWLSYTYLHVRMCKNPMAYGIPYDEIETDPSLTARRHDMIAAAARSLDKTRMIRFDERTGYLSATDLGRTASNFYIKHETIELFNEKFKAYSGEENILNMISQSQEFDNIQVREDEMKELEKHYKEHTVMDAAGGAENAHGKVNILLQTFITKASIDTFSLVSDSNYVAQNSARILRALMEIAIKKGQSGASLRLLTLCLSLEKRLWSFEHPLRQFENIKPELMRKLEVNKVSVERIKDSSADEVGALVHHHRMGGFLKKMANTLPQLSVSAGVQPITRTVLRVHLTIKADFVWDDKVHGTLEPWWIWVEDANNEHMYHSEYFILHKKHWKEPHELVFTIPIFEPLPPQYFIRIHSDRWLGTENVTPLSFKHLILPQRHPPHTELLDLKPLPVTVLRNEIYQSLYPFSHFNPIQTQIFHTLYHTDSNVLLGAPTGSGKTIAAEISIFRAFNEWPKKKIVYIAPLKALVKERMKDWKPKFADFLGKKVVELTGDVSPDAKSLRECDVIVTTPEKWDGISRSWQSRNYVKDVCLVVIDEIHLLGADRGPVLEVIVSRMNFISSTTERKIRIVGLSTALANARDLADWLGIEKIGLFNFRPSVRPVPLEVHIAGFPGKHYCPRMATMNKPCYAAIMTHSPSKPCLIFVSSRRQTRLTALDIISYTAGAENPKQFLSLTDEELDSILLTIQDSSLKLTLNFGIGLHHAGLHENDRNIVEHLFATQKIQVLVATSTLAWGVNLPAHLVIVKGTEYFDGKTKMYVDYPITDVLQMMGRAGRPQFDDEGKAVILVQDVKKNFYKKFLYEPFPVESSLKNCLHNHINAEIVAGTISNRQGILEYLTWTYLFRRLYMNPSYYDLDGVDHEQVSKFLSDLIEKIIVDLEKANCIYLDEEGLKELAPKTLGIISSFYYLDYRTVGMFHSELKENCTIEDILKVLSDSAEFAELPVRHNEDLHNEELAKELPFAPPPNTFDSSHTKTFLLLQARLCRSKLPFSDYVTDTKSVLDQVFRVLQGMVDASADAGWLSTTLEVMVVCQMIVQAQWDCDPTVLQLPHITDEILPMLCQHKISSHLPEVVAMKPDQLRKVLIKLLQKKKVDEIMNALRKFPVIDVKYSINGRCVVGEECIFSIRLTKLQKGGSTSQNSKAFAKHMTKPIEEGWWVVIGDSLTSELFAMKKISMGSRKSISTNLSFQLDTPGESLLTVYLISDCYLGLDQQYVLSVNATSH
eukprot:Nk52_evm43s164 gene=Nk52_evmTU43s164